MEKIICPKTKKIAYRETDTLDTFVDSSWYYIRFLNNKLNQPFQIEDVNQYLPVDKYIGGLNMLYFIYFIQGFLESPKRYLQS